MPTQPDNEWIPEEQLADELGVPREKIRAERPYTGPGEVTKRGNVILWLRSARERVAAKLGITLQKNTAPELSAALKDDAEELTVCSQPVRNGGPHFGNQNLIKATRPNGEVVVVRVLHASKFMPKLRSGEAMTFKAKKADAGNWWLLTGREPRFPGQW